MSGFQSHSMSHSAFLRIAANILVKCVFEADRTNAKAMFNNLLDGDTEQLIKVKMEDGSELQFDVNLDYSEYRGKLNYSAFKTSLGVLLATIGECLKAEHEVRVLTDEHSGALVFVLPGLAEDKDSGEINALLLGANLSQPGRACLNLQFFEPEQFVTKKSEDEAES